MGTAGLAATGAVATQWFNVLAETGADALDPAQAHAAAMRGAIILVDIRRPDEWSRTGIGEGAIPLDMRRADFDEALLQVLGGDSSRTVALICARGVRSRRMSGRLTAAGFSGVVDVPEGMLGSGAGPGWLRRGLPVAKPPAG